MNYIKLGLLLLTFTCLTMSCKSDSKSIAAEIDTVLDIRLDRDPTRINPMIYPKPTSRLVFQNIFRSCADIDPYTLEMIPILIEKLPKKVKHDDGSVSFDLQIRKEAVWPNGSPITGDDYLFTLKAIAHPKVNAPSFRSFTQKITAVKIDESDRKSFTVTLKEDYLLADETVLTVEIYPQYIYDPVGRMNTPSLAYLFDSNNENDIANDTTLMTFATEMNGLKFSQQIAVGAGPYQLKSYTADQKIVLEEVEDFWGNQFPDIPQLQSGPEEIVFHIVPDKTAAVNLLKEGSVDLISGLEGSTFKELQESEYTASKLKFATPNMPRYYYLMLNTLSPELSDVNVRMALENVLDVETCISVLESGMGQKVNSPIRPTASYYNQSLPEQQFNVQKANELLDKAGWIDGDKDGIREKKIEGKLVPLRLKMSASPGKLSGQIGQILKSDAAKAGIDIDLIEKSPKLFNTENIKTGDYHIAAQANTQYLALYDPYQKWHSDNAQKGSNYSGYTSSTLDQLIEQIRSEQDLDKLTPMYHQFQQIISKEKPIVFLYSPTAKIAYNKNWMIQPSVIRPGYFANTATSSN